MKKLIFLLIITGLFVFLACEVDTPQQPQYNILQNQLVLRKMVAVGNSLTMGIQSGGIIKDFQLHSYPYFIAQQMGKASEFQQPIVEAPGLGQGGLGPMKFENGTLVSGDPSPADPTTIASNLLLPRPYDNLGVSGADLKDVLNTKSGGLFDLVLRNPNLGNLTQIEEALLLNPSLLLLWIGPNDVLGAALSGTAVVGTTITPESEFESMYNELLQKIRTNSPQTQIVIANIPNVSDIPYVNFLDIIFRPAEWLGITDPVPVMFDETLQPIDFDPTPGTKYIPILTEEKNVAHLLLPALSAYLQGVGMPDSAAMVQMGVPSITASFFVTKLKAAGLNPSGVAFDGTQTLTEDESTTIANTVVGFNSFIGGLGLPMVDANKMLSDLNNGNIAGVSGKFVLLAPTNTAFSLDGVHPNNGGYALVANEFLRVINQTFQLSIPLLNADNYLGQYVGANITRINPGAFDQVKKIFVSSEK